MSRPLRPLDRNKTSLDPWPRIKKRIQGYKDRMVAAYFRQAGLPAAVWMTSSETAHHQ